MMKSILVLLLDTFQQAITFEKIHTPLNTHTPMVNKIADDQDNVQLDGEIEAVRVQLNRLTSKKNRTQISG
jgi:hypothetical protein